MHSKIFSSTLLGLEGRTVEIEADISQGLPAFIIVGLPDTAVQESRERIRSAIRNSTFPFPRTRVTINLAPADLKKVGSYFDLPIALALLSETLDGKTPLSFSKRDLIVGELALDGAIRPVSGALSFALLAREKGFKRFIVPYENVSEASLVPDITIVGVKTLTDAVHYLAGVETKGVRIGVFKDSMGVDKQSLPNSHDFSNIFGQEQVKRAFEIAAAGGHNVAMVGSPGAGKTMLAEALPTLLPPLLRDEVIELTRIYSAAGILKGGGLIKNRPFRSPHHSASVPALIGGGNNAKPGEISLAHRGVLFLDEAAEFPKNVLESLRQPLEEGTVTVSRIRDTVDYPSRFMLVLATNPCPCGYYQDAHKKCICSIGSVQKYHKKLSGPLLDRIDMHLHVPSVDIDHLDGKRSGEPSTAIRERVMRARMCQKEKLISYGVTVNAELSTAQLQEQVSLSSDAETLIRSAAKKLHLSARSYFRVLKVALTISNLASSSNVTEAHVAEALQYRPQSFLDI